MAENTLINFSNLTKVLNEYRMTLLNLYRDHLIEEDHIATENLLNKSKTIIDNGNGSIEVSLSLLDYWKYVEWDTKPHFPPIDKILEWVKVKPVLPSKTYNGKLPTEKQLAFLIARKISEVGTKGTNDLTDSIKQVNAIYDEKISEAIAQDVDKALTSILLQFYSN